MKPRPRFPLHPSRPRFEALILTQVWTPTSIRTPSHSDQPRTHHLYYRACCLRRPSLPLSSALLFFFALLFLLRLDERGVDLQEPCHRHAGGRKSVVFPHPHHRATHKALAHLHLLTIIIMINRGACSDVFQDPAMTHTPRGHLPLGT